MTERNEGGKPAGAGREGARAFTLIEILTVVAIMSLLMATIIAVTAGAQDKARRKGTEGLLQQLSMALQRYYTEFHTYPPDGYDEPVTAPNGKKLQGSASLTYYLAWMYPDGSGDFIRYDMQKPDYTDPEHIRMVPVHGEEPFWVGVKPKKQLNSYGEILDKWNNPLRYDNCERTKDEKVLYSPNIQPMAGGRDPDPREARNNGRPFNSGTRDIWSCGANGNTAESDAEDDIIGGREDTK